MDGAAPPPQPSWVAGRRRARLDSADERRWAPKWRRLVAGGAAAGPPGGYAEFDRTVRGMLNRISTENAPRLLPLEPALRGAGADAGDCPPWWATRFAAHMLSSYLQVVHTHRCARGLAVRGSDNVLPEYLDAVAPLLAKSPRLVEALAAWLARLLRWHELCWPTARLVLLAAHSGPSRGLLPPHALGRLPPELLRGRVLAFLAPPALGSFGSERLEGPPAALCGCWSTEDGRKDAVSVLVHLLLFAPQAAWPRLSACAFSLAEAALAGPDSCQDWRLYLAASVLVAVAQRLERSLDGSPRLGVPDGNGQGSEEPSPPRRPREDLAPLVRLAALLSGAAAAADAQRLCDASTFVDLRVEVALEHARRVRERCKQAELP